MAHVAYCHQHSGRASIILQDGRTVTFHQHLFQTNNEALIALLDSHTLYGTAFKRVERSEEIEQLRDAETKYTHGVSVTMTGPQESIQEKLKPTFGKKKGQR